MARRMSRDELLRVDGVKPNENLASLLGPAGDAGQTTISVPWLVNVGPYHTPTVRCHRLVAAQMLRAFELIDELGLRGQVLSYDGCYVYRHQRGGSSLSAHAWGAAVDLNAPWNALGQPPAKRGATGSLYEVLGVFEACGFGWGGWWRRPDGMHFQVARVLKAEELPVLATSAPVGVQLPGGVVVDYRVTDGVAWAPLRQVVESLGGKVDTTSWPLITVTGRV